MIEIRSTSPEEHNHHAQLKELLSQTQVPGSLSYHYERSAGYSAYARTQGTHYQLFEAHEDEKLLGITQITFDQVNWNGSSFQVCYSGDTRVSPLARGKGISNSLIQSACSQPIPVFGAVMEDNSVVLQKKLKDWRNLGVDFREVAEMKAFFYRPKTAKTNRTGLVCRPASNHDLEIMFDLWKEYGKARNLSRHYPDLSSFQASYSQTPGISLDQTLLVFKGSNLIAMLSLWNQTHIRKIIVDRKNLALKLISKFIPLPAEGDEMKILYSFQHAFLPNHPLAEKSLGLLIDQAREIGFRNQAHFITLGMDTSDEKIGTFQKPSLFSNRIKIILDSRGNHDFETSQIPFHLEVGMG